MSDHLEGRCSVLVVVLLALAACHREVTEDESADESRGHGAEPTEPGAEGESREREVQLTPATIARYGIKTARATKAILVPELAVAARVVFNPEAMAHVGTPVAGRAREVRVKLGDAVKKGDVLVVVDSPELGTAQSEFLMKRREAETAVPAVEVARSSYERGKAFYDESRGITLTELQRRETEWKSAAAALANIRGAVIAAESRLRLLGMSKESGENLAATGEIDPAYVITAPIDGQVVERSVTLGELVGPDREPLLVLADMRTLWVLADVPEARLPEVAIGSVARLSVPALGDAKLAGKVTFFAPEIDVATRTAAVRIEVDCGAGLRPGMFAQAWIARGGPPSEPVLAIPEEAVQTVAGMTVVFVPSDQPDEFKPQEVVVGAAVSGMLPVVEGLKEGDEFVASGSFVLKAELGKSSVEED